MILSNAELKKITQKKFPASDLARQWLAEVDKVLEENDGQCSSVRRSVA